MTYEIVRLADAPKEFGSWREDIPAIDAHPKYGAFGRHYYPLVYEQKRSDESFAVVKRGQAQVLVPCSVGEGRLDWYDLPIAFFRKQTAEQDESDTAITAAFAHIDKLVEHYGTVCLTIRDEAPNFSAIGQHCSDYGLLSSCWSTAVCDLTLSEDELHKKLRRRYKPQINWGKKSLKIELLNESNPDVDLFDRYRDFHRKIAGRVTRPKSSWDAMFNWIRSGNGELVFGYLDDRLVSAVMTIDGRTTSMYSSGAFERELFADNKPLAHWPMWFSVLRSKERGLQLYDVGEIPNEGQATPKEVRIGFFKQGFASTISIWRSWSMDYGNVIGVHEEAFAALENQIERC